MESLNSTRLSVNINKLATIRNARGGNNPDLIAFAARIEQYGAQGITIHPRPDQRHIRLDDVYLLKEGVTTEFNIEGYPSRDFIDMVIQVKPEQVTLVPDAPDVITSNNGWDTVKHREFLTDIIGEFHDHGIRTSIFLNPDTFLIDSAAKTGTDRIELYTESYASNFHTDRKKAIGPYIATALAAKYAGLGLNAGHDLDIHNLKYFRKEVPGLLEVSIGHALICDALEYGMEKTIRLYLEQLQAD